MHGVSWPAEDDWMIVRIRRVGAASEVSQVRGKTILWRGVSGVSGVTGVSGHDSRRTPGGGREALEAAGEVDEVHRGGV